MQRRKRIEYLLLYVYVHHVLKLRKLCRYEDVQIKARLNPTLTLSLVSAMALLVVSLLVNVESNLLLDTIEGSFSLLSIHLPSLCWLLSKISPRKNLIQRHLSQ